MQRGLATSYLELADSECRLEQFDTAANHFQQALDIQETLVTSDLPWHRVHHQLSTIYYEFGELKRKTNQMPEALQLHQRAIELREEFVRRGPLQTDWRKNLADSHRMTGLILRTQRQADEALPHYERACELLANLAQENPTASIRGSLVSSYEGLSSAHVAAGDALRTAGNPDEALGHYEKAIEILEQVAEASSGEARIPSRLVLTNRIIGHAHRNSGNPEAAVTAYRKAIELHEELLRNLPEIPAGRRYGLAGVYYELGTQLEATNALQEALRAYEQAVHQQCLALETALPAVREQQLRVYTAALTRLKRTLGQRDGHEDPPQSPTGSSELAPDSPR